LLIAFFCRSKCLLNNITVKYSLLGDTMRNTNGLTKEEVINNRKKYGTNKITNKKNNTFFKLFIESLGDPIIKVLLIAVAVKTLFLFKDFDYFETIGIVLAILIASLISSISEYGSNKAFQRLQEENSKIKCRVKRNNKLEEINIDEIVYNDIVYLTTGDRVPADGILVKGNLTIDESMISGEAKETYKESIVNINNTQDKNKLYRGTIVYENEGFMLVTSVGNNTMYGSLAMELQEKSTPSPLRIKLTNLAKTISKIGYIAAVLVAISYLFNKIVIENNFDINLIVSTTTNYKIMFAYILNALTLVVTIIVVAVPEGLPMMITLVLSSNMKRMLKNNVLVRKLVGIETAGSLNVLFTDKTGTLTKGNMEVENVILGNNRVFNNFMEINNYPKYEKLFSNSIVYNNQGIYDKDENKVIGGNITDKALLNFVKKVRNPNIKIVDKIPFNSENKYSITTIKEDNKNVKLIKGAYEKILKYCTYYYDEYGVKQLFKNKDKLEKNIDNITRNGIRAIAIAISNDSLVTDNLRGSTLVSIILVKDEIRKEAKEGIKLIDNAHVKTIMITGDNKNTAISIAREVGLVKDSKDIVITSNQLNSMPDEKVKEIIPNLKVVARALPSDKSRLVTLTKEMGLVVGMTGDGVNDAVALKKADVGFAMGSGTEVSKEASDIVILDDNINSIAHAILYGRTIFKSIRKFIIFQLTVNFSAVFISIVGPFIGIPYPVTVIQMLWINMVMDTLAGLAFSFEPPLFEYMKEEPKKKDENIINSYMLNEIIITGLYTSILYILFLKLHLFQSFYRVGIDNEYLMTAFFTLFIFTTIFNSFNARTHRLNLFANLYKNKVFIGVILFICIIQLYLIYYGGNLFRTSGLLVSELIFTLIISLTVIPIDFLRKIILKKLNFNIKV